MRDGDSQRFPAIWTADLYALVAPLPCAPVRRVRRHGCGTRRTPAGAAARALSGRQWSLVTGRCTGSRR
ncbi:MAG TPA: hypothetical protein VFA70_07875 [Dehalococcoidia bacterium]|jgi:hypothetical protein|nr:hypothetical protein [Dehalococcoidia bacterium]